MLLIICFIIIVIYLVLITFINSGFNKVEDFKLQDLKPETKFSVIIPFRNEAKNFKNLLTCINALNYPKSHFEVILVNDASTDNWQTIFNSLKPTKANNITVIIY